MSNKRTKIPRESREMRDELCRSLGIEEGLLPFVGELLDVSQEEESWRKTIEVLLANFALSVVVPEDKYGEVAGYVEASRFRRRFTYFRAPRGTGASVTLDSSRISGKVQIRPDAWCRSWLQMRLLGDYPHRCCETVEQFKAERERAVTKNMHVKGGDRSYKESQFTERDFDILGWSNEAKIADFRARLAHIQADIVAREKEVTNLSATAKGVSGGLGLVRQITQISSFRSIDVATIETEITIASDRREELEASDSKLAQLTATLKEAEIEKDGVAKQRDIEVQAEGELKETISQLKQSRMLYGGRFNKACEDFDWHAWENDVRVFRGSAPLVIDNLGGGGGGKYKRYSTRSMWRFAQAILRQTGSRTS